MTSRRLELQRDIDLPPAIVWDALTDPALVGGWLGEARIDPVVNGRFDVEWLGRRDYPGTVGTISLIDEPNSLTVETATHGRIAFRLDERPGGTRGHWTALHLRIDVDVDDAFAGRISANWTTALEQLEELLRGHPVDWAPLSPEESTPPVSRDIRRR